MLTQIHIHNFAIIKNLDLELNPGMTAITGETGAGKSIVIDALDIALGGRADPQLIRQDSQHCDITLAFDIHDIPRAQAWLEQQTLFTPSGECIIRRHLSRTGRSKSYINGQPVTRQQLRELGSYLVHVHSQHQHHTLLQNQRQILDRLLERPQLLQQVNHAFNEWQQAKAELQACLAQQNDTAKRDLLAYQVQELTELELLDGEWDALTQQHQQLAHRETIQTHLQACLEILHGDTAISICQSLATIERHLLQIKQLLPDLDNCFELIQNASVELTEAVDEIKQLLHHIDTDPDTFNQLEKRLSALHTIARKHHIHPKALITHYQQLQTQLAEFLHNEEKIAGLQQCITNNWLIYYKFAEELHQARCYTATKVARQITASMQGLGMPAGQFAIQVELNPNNPTAYGLDTIDFQITTNLGQPMNSMSKIASGGELSRINLAIQVITAQQDDTPTLIFDEVDLGISGATAEIVGKLLHKLSKTSQVLCITHLPQVAAQGHQHLKINKKVHQDQTISELISLDQSQRIEEIARMVGGTKITPQALAHAAELLGTT